MSIQKPIIGVLGVTASLYKKRLPEFVEELERQYKSLVQECFLFADIVSSPLVYERRMVERFYAKMVQMGVDGIIIMFPSYSPSMIIAPILKKSQVPILIWNTQHLFKITRSFSARDMMNNHGMHGVQDLTCVLLRERTPFSIITGHYTQRETMVYLKNWCGCVAICNALKKLKIGRIGGRFKDMGDFSISDDTIHKIFGVEIMDIEMAVVEKEAKEISQNDIDRVLKNETNRFTIEIDNTTHKNLICLELALRNIINRYGLGALAVNFMAFKGIFFYNQMPFYAISKFISEGMGYGGEGDTLCAISVWILQKLAGQATFTEMFTTDYRNNRIFMSHMGENNISMAKSGSEIRLVEKDMNIVNSGSSTGMFLFQMKPGNVTLFNISPYENEKFRFIAAKGRIENKKMFSDIKAPHFLLKVKGDVRDFLTCYSLYGGTHHLAMAYGDYNEQIRTLADIIGLQFLQI
ncbi:MAG: hypothetical protein NC830_02520 [Candidatus Omnitrophica bacterium]|nr:hypothetical protein [Candidatus Omnitrophota bacterium]